MVRSSNERWSNFLDNRDGYAKRQAFRLVRSIRCAREREREREKKVAGYASRKRAVSDNNLSLSNVARLDANRFTSSVSERQGVQTRRSGFVCDAAEDHSETT